jgi:hypothetical protein
VNESAVIEALDTLISDNIQTLMSGMTKGGYARSEYVVTQTTLTPLVNYLYIAIDISETAGQSVPDGGMPKQLAKPSLREARYTTIIGVTDMAILQQDEDQPYEKLHRDFRRFTDRLVDLVEEQRWIMGPDDQKYELLRTGATSDRAVRKRNMSGPYLDQETQMGYFILYSQIEFTLIEKCPDRTLLYT